MTTLVETAMSPLQPTLPQITVLGIGNLLWADEGFGVRCVEALQQRYEFADNVALIDGGTGTDTLKMDAANAATASQTSTFATKFTGFEKLELNAYTGLNKVDLSNMNNISHVVSANGTAGAGASSTWAGVGSKRDGR